MLLTYFEQKLEERYTWFSNDGITKRVLDYILAEEFILQYVMNCKTEGTQDFGSDHRLVVTILNTPMCKIARWKPRKERRKCVKKDLSSLDNPNICKEFLKNLENKFPIEQETYSTEIAEQKL